MHTSIYLTWIFGTLLTILPVAKAIEYEFCPGHEEKSCALWWEDEFAVFQESIGQWKAEDVGRALHDMQV